MIVGEEGWVKPKKILIILAHPDDPEFFCGATIARWVKYGHYVVECLFTRGDKGSHDPAVKPLELAKIREAEQKAAARVLGVEEVNFLNYQDGYLVPSLDARRDVIRVVRKEKPDIVVTSDPTNLFTRPGSINHPDHRAAGQIVVDAVFPGVVSPHYFPELIQEGYQPHVLKEIWLSIPANPNVTLDVTDFWDLKIHALWEHRTQIGNPVELEKRMRERRTPLSLPDAPRFEEKFYRIVFP
ncbi:MAG: PIG-L deacetylase family protein [Anaerolineaceae bacterium]|jgi:LmbE family N-acetylglucosaminyl deacetylase